VVFRAGELESWRVGELESWRVGELESWRGYEGTRVRGYEEQGKKEKFPLFYIFFELEILPFSPSPQKLVSPRTNKPKRSGGLCRERSRFLEVGGQRLEVRDER
jgi:hypothetical protein